MSKECLVYASWAKDDAIRTTSSSGGVFSVLANAILDVGGYVYGAAFDDKLFVRHMGIKDRSELYRLQGSKYVKSDLTGIYRQVKDHLCNNHTVLFTGTPCQIAGLRSFLKQPYKKLFTCDVICHGVPLQEMFNLYLKQINITPDSGNFSFRYCKGWGYELSYKNKPLSIKDTYYMKAFTKGFMFMEACYKCKYATLDRISDITLGDYWGIGAEKSFNHSKKKGVSLILINSEKGEQLLDVCRNELFLEKRELQEAVAGNHNLRAPANRPEQRNSFCQDMRQMSKEEIMDKYSLHPSVRDYLRPIMRFFKQFVS